MAVRRRGPSAAVFQTLNYAVLAVLAVLTVYPFVRVLLVSMTPNSELVEVGRSVLYFPTRPSLLSYRLILETDTIPRAYVITLFRVIVGTALSILVSLLLAYPLSRTYLKGKRPVLFLIAFTMLFGGGLIPTYMIVRSLGLIDNVWVLILPRLVSAFNVIIMRNYFMTIPDSLEESAKLDGANDFVILGVIMIPPAAPMLAAITLFYAVEYWNEFFQAVIYINNHRLYPLQVVLREILFQSSGEEVLDIEITKASSVAVRMATIVVTTVPVLLVYPFLQRYFAQGILLGSVKQ